MIRVVAANGRLVHVRPQHMLRVWVTVSVLLASHHTKVNAASATNSPLFQSNQLGIRRKPPVVPFAANPPHNACDLSVGMQVAPVDIPRRTEMRRTIISTAALLATAIATPAGAQDIGVPVCDTFLKTFRGCVAANGSPEQKTQLGGIMDKMQENWRAVAATAEGKKALEGVCKTTADQLKAQGAIKCDW
jgi:hypothetical protein